MLSFIKKFIDSRPVIQGSYIPPNNALPPPPPVPENISLPMPEIVEPRAENPYFDKIISDLKQYPAEEWSCNTDFRAAHEWVDLSHRSLQYRISIIVSPIYDITIIFVGSDDISELFTKTEKKQINALCQNIASVKEKIGLEIKKNNLIKKANKSILGITTIK